MKAQISKQISSNGVNYACMEGIAVKQRSDTGQGNHWIATPDMQPWCDSALAPNTISDKITATLRCVDGKSYTEYATSGAMSSWILNDNQPASCSFTESSAPYPSYFSSAYPTDYIESLKQARDHAQDVNLALIVILTAWVTYLNICSSLENRRARLQKTNSDDAPGVSA